MERREFLGHVGVAAAAAADYLGAAAGDIALTQSTTEAIALVYNGLAVAQGQELLTTGWRSGTSSRA